MNTDKKFGIGVYPRSLAAQIALDGGEQEEWLRMTPAERWAESEKLWETYLALGGSLDP